MYSDISFLLRSKLSYKILECINSEDTPISPLQISKKTDIARSNVSTKIGPLTKKGLVVCVNPDDKKWRFYKITNKGKLLLNKTKKFVD